MANAPTQPNIAIMLMNIQTAQRNAQYKSCTEACPQREGVTNKEAAAVLGIRLLLCVLFFGVVWLVQRWLDRT